MLSIENERNFKNWTKGFDSFVDPMPEAFLRTPCTFVGAK